MRFISWRLLEKIEPRLLEAFDGGDDNVEVGHFREGVGCGDFRIVGFKEEEDHLFRLVPEYGDSFLDLGVVFIGHGIKASFLE